MEGGRKADEGKGEGAVTYLIVIINLVRVDVFETFIIIIVHLSALELESFAGEEVDGAGDDL